MIKGTDEEVKAFIEKIEFEPPKSAVVFNVTADFSTDPVQIKDNMARQLCNPVKWYHSMQQLINEEIEVFAEVGPGKVLTGLMRKNMPKDYPGKIYSVGDLKSLEKFLKENT